MGAIRRANPQRHWWAFSLLALGVLGLIAVGHDGRRVAQLAMLALPPLLWLLLPLQSRLWRRVRGLVVGVMVLAFGVDGLTRGYLQDRYAAAPDSSVVLEAVANANVRETKEYLQTNWVDTGLHALGLLACIAAAALLLNRDFGGGVPPLSKPLRIVLLVLLVLCSIGYLSKPWRRLHPLAFWPQWVAAVQTTRTGWTEQHALRAHRLQHARSLAPTVQADGPSTVVLVLTDSVNRSNMSVFGYPRDTTPQLRASRDALGEQMLFLPHAWSTEPGTLASLRTIFGFGQTAPESPLHLLALAREAGYKVWWMSNHDDLAINQTHAQLADEVEIINRQPGRSGASLDGELLDCLDEALRDPTPRKFVVVHLLGAHPHYRLRQPDAWSPFAGHDAVDDLLAGQGRARWVREMRRDYDEALRYHDGVVAETLRLTRSAGDLAGHRAWMYLSDHGQEVGHTGNRVGHSLDTAEGYRIPAIIWRNQGRFDDRLASRPFRADWAAWTLADLLQLRWPTMEPQRNVLGTGYAWQPPALPVPQLRFSE